MPDPIKHIRCGDHRIAFHDTGTGPALVLAHGLGLDLSIWDRMLPLLPQGLRIIRFDLRGHGASSCPPPPFSMGALVRDAEALLDELGVHDCVFLGAGLGGMVAQGLAVKRLDQIRALVLANTATKIGTAQTWDRQIALWRDNRGSFDDSPSFAGASCLPDGFQAQTPLDGLLGCAAAIAGTDFYTTTAGLRLPCLIIAGGRDAITPADMVRDLADLIPGAEFALIRKAGHVPMLEQPEAFAAVLVDFLRAIGHATTGLYRQPGDDKGQAG